MNPKNLRSPEERVGTLPNADLPPPDRKPLSSEALLRSALLDGDARAFDEATRRMMPVMARIAAHYVRSPDDAQDVIQDTWLSALGAIHRFEDRASLRTWLLRILTYRARTAGRRASRTIPMSQLGAADAPDRPMWDIETPLFAHGPVNPDDELLAAELTDAVAQAAAELPARQREVFVLRDVEGWTSEDVSRRMDVSAANQRVLLHRARAALRRNLSGAWSEAS